MVLLIWVDVKCLRHYLTVATRNNGIFRLRLRFGSWLALALDYQLGADILATTIAPSWEASGQLGVIALIRTFLNYFLTQELEAEAKLKATMKETKN